MTGKQRAFLRSKATAIDATFQIGKGGVSENMLIAVEQALAAHEMVKIKCLENCEYTPREASDGICEALGAEGVQCIGNKFVIFKISPEHRRYDLDKLCEIEEKKDKEKEKETKKRRTAPVPKNAIGGKPRMKNAPGAPGVRNAGTASGKPRYTVRKGQK